MTDKLMVDIETLSTHPGNALVLSIGAVRFGIGDDTGPDIGEKRTYILSLHEQLLAGREVSIETQRWWAQQSPEARQHWQSSAGQNAFTVLTGLAEFSAGVTTVWANGIVFDLGNIESLYRANGIALPWQYNAPRDARTLYDLPKRRIRSDVTEHVAHDPVADCIDQIWRLWEHWPDATQVPV